MRLLDRAALAVVAILGSACYAVFAQTYPSKPIRIFTAPPGGGTDLATRVLAQGLAGPLSQQVIVENRPSGVILIEAVAKAPSDGRTLLLFTNGLWLLPLMQKVPYDPVKDFAPVSLVGTTPHVIVVHPSLPVNRSRI